MFFAETKPNRTRAQRNRKSPARLRTTSSACVGFSFPRLCSSPLIDASPAALRYPDPHFSANLSGMRTYKNGGANSLRMRTYETEDLNPFRIRTYKMQPTGVPSVFATPSLLQSTNPLESNSCTNRVVIRPGIILLTLKVGGRGCPAHFSCQTPSCNSSSLAHQIGASSLSHAHVR
jgi:hypothetical protein